MGESKFLDIKYILFIFLLGIFIFGICFYLYFQNKREQEKVKGFFIKNEEVFY